MSETADNTFLATLERLKNAEPDELVQQLMSLYGKIRAMNKDEIVILVQTIRTIASKDKIQHVGDSPQMLQMYNACRVRMLELVDVEPTTWRTLWTSSLYNHLEGAFGRSLQHEARNII